MGYHQQREQFYRAHDQLAANRGWVYTCVKLVTDWVCRQNYCVARVVDGKAAQKPESEIAAELKAELASVANERSKVIASAEATMLINAGAVGAIGFLATQGIGVTKTWHTMKDEKVRPTHAALEGTSIDAGESFKVGSLLAAFPGDPALPVEERAGCRCWVS